VLCWSDPAYAYAEIEPVGTVPAHSGRSVGSALIRFGLRDAGVSDVVVGARADPDYPVPRRFYESVGFASIATQVIVRRPSS
jgi:GNAT superfamily N-acetyltransferase